MGLSSLVNLSIEERIAGNETDIARGAKMLASTSEHQRQLSWQRHTSDDAELLTRRPVQTLGGRE